MDFWSATGSALSARLLASAGPTSVFWVWAFAVWSIPRGGWSHVERTLHPLLVGTGTAALLGVAVVALVVVTTSHLLVGRLTMPVLRLLEGYWPAVLGALRERRVTRWQAKAQELTTPSLPGKPARYTPAVASAKLRAFPPHPQVMPTRIGNIVRAGERRPATWYGLDAVIVWPQLWLVLPEQPRADLVAARGALDRTVTAFVWALLSCGLSLVWPPAALIGAGVAVTIWRWWIPAAATNYATLVGAVFDTHRIALYDALRYPRPPTPADEPALGRALTRSLWDDPSQAPSAYAPRAAADD